MNEVLDYQYERIVALEARVAELERYVLELCDDDCPKEYKKSIINRIN